NDWGNLLSSFFDNGELAASRADFSPKVDIVEEDNCFKLQAELPGMKKSDIQLEIKDQTLVLRGERKFTNEEKRENYQRIERAYGTFSRGFALPSNIDTQSIDAKYEDGVLQVTLNKRPE